ncbi:Acetyltransferase (GNAT) family protein [Pedobacter suwonensis]|uniref:Acetyltransferase (GNAT) family protein n=1 Tax=Pedobacter suwonensis TaxID=332999 RepID=A0A1I0TQN5_9SPHI|nr:GNAT family N-acetyltransferase [Pedobacter suwonensis]SFA54065.1 Acetyltransferase (GNAT) family protein [Pedobacter suwonensis]
MIRRAKPEDATQVVPLLLQAMAELAPKLTQTQDQSTINRIFEHFFQQSGNQYSYENTLVFEEADKVHGSLTAYDGAKLLELRKPFLIYLSQPDITDNHLDAETQSGEFYLDSISVNVSAQGKGIGKQLIKAGLAWGKQSGHQTIGLLVEQIMRGP